MLSLIGVVVQDVDALVGLDCNPITVIGVGTGDQCNTQAVCCQDNNVVCAVLLCAMDVLFTLAYIT